jgi:hypothetical protein
MTSVGMRCSNQADEMRGRPGGADKAAPAQRRMGHCTANATIGSKGNNVGITVSLSAKSLATVTDLTNSAIKLGCEGVQMVEDAAKATADLAGEVLEHGVRAGVVGAAIVSVLV